MSTQIHEFVNSNGPKMGSDVTQSQRLTYAIMIASLFQENGSGLLLNSSTAQNISISRPTKGPECRM